MDEEAKQGQEAGDAGTTEPAKEPAKEPSNEPTTEPTAGEPKPDDGLKDSHGQPGISRDKYEREMKAANERISELQAKLDESAKTEQGREELRKEIDELKAKHADEQVSFKLELAGCRNVKAAKALLDDHDGDVDKLKESEPWLFDNGKHGSTGLKPDGTNAAKAARLDKARKAARGEIFK